jgi:hypothetical protein
VFAIITLLELVHFGWKTASEVRVIADEGAIVRTPLDGRVKAVQGGWVEVVEGKRSPSQIALPSISKSFRASRWSSMVSAVVNRHRNVPDFFV